MTHRTPDELDAALTHVLEAPADDGELLLIVRRPGEDERESLDEGALDVETGLVGDNWALRGSSRTADGHADPLAQLTLMNSRVIELIAGSVDRWPLAGDQLYVDLNLSERSLPAGSRLSVGEAVLEVTAKPHRGCAKFTRRFGLDATRWVNSEIGRSHRLRGVNTQVIKSGTISVGDRITISSG